jgi:lysophospholipase L1-like esterase
MSEGKEGAPVIYVALGDSTGAGVGARKGGGYVARIFHRIERVRAGSRLTNLCVSGATSTDVLRAQLPRVADVRPTLLTLGIGINDAQRLTPEQYGRNYEEIITRLTELEGAAVVVTNIPDISSAPVIPAPMREEAHRVILVFNEIIRGVAERHRLLLVDVYEQSREVVPAHPEFFSPDGFHPSDEGYEYWAQMMWPTVKKAIGEE